MSARIIKTCSCKRTYTQEQWEQLPGKQIYEFEWGEVHEQRHCVCRSTIVLVLKQGYAEIPNATYFEGGTVEANVRGYPVHYYKGADFWRVCVLGERHTRGDGQNIPLITPHVFKCPEEAHDWFLRWLDGQRTWDSSWGNEPDWPLPKKKGFLKWTPKKNSERKRPRGTRFNST